MGWDAVEDKDVDGVGGDRADEEQDEKGEAQVVAGGRGQKVKSGLLQGGESSRIYTAMQKIKPVLVLVEPPYLQLLVW